MKTLFIPAKIKSIINEKAIIELSKTFLKNITNITISYSIQYEELEKMIKQILSKSHNITSFVHVLGCSKPDFPKSTEAVLLMGSGRFHAISLAIETSLPIYIIENSKITKLSEQETEQFRKKQKAAYLKFLNSDKAGILVSSKPGQENLEKAIALKKKLKKKAYIFIGNEINSSEFENFSLNSWINTACPRLDMESNSIVNINRIK